MDCGLTICGTPTFGRSNRKNRADQVFRRCSRQLPKLLVLISECELGGLRSVLPFALAATNLIELPSKTIPGLPEQGFDLRSESLHVGPGRLKDRIAVGAVSVEEMKIGRLDVPFAELVLRADDLTVLDRFEDRRLAQAGGGCSSCEGV
jgi:hypothetical protein